MTALTGKTLRRLAGDNIPSGYILGRTKGGVGPVHPIKLSDLLSNPQNGVRGGGGGGDVDPIFTSATPGYVPASGGGTTNFMRADGTWASPGAGAAFPTQLKFYLQTVATGGSYTPANDAGVFMMTAASGQGTITFNFPAAPTDNQILILATTISLSQINLGTGTYIGNNIFGVSGSSMNANNKQMTIYHAANTTWYGMGGTS